MLRQNSLRSFNLSVLKEIPSSWGSHKNLKIIKTLKIYKGLQLIFLYNFIFVRMFFQGIFFLFLWNFLRSIFMHKRIHFRLREVFVLSRKFQNIFWTGPKKISVLQKFPSYRGSWRAFTVQYNPVNVKIDYLF